MGTGVDGRIERLLTALAAAGVTPHSSGDVRDAVHEAAHALDWDVPKPWTHDAISDCAPRRASEKFAAELRARAVEELVCEALSVEIEPREERALVALMEATNIDRYNVPHKDWVKGITLYREHSETMALAARILAMAEGT